MAQESRLPEISDEKPIRIIPDKKYPNMYRLQRKDGSVSVKYSDPDDNMPDGNPVSSYGMYNLTRAKDILRNYQAYVDDMRLAIRMRGNTIKSDANRSRKVTDEFDD